MTVSWCLNAVCKDSACGVLIEFLCHRRTRPTCSSTSAAGNSTGQSACSYSIRTRCPQGASMTALSRSLSLSVLKSVSYVCNVCAHERFDDSDGDGCVLGRCRRSLTRHVTRSLKRQRRKSAKTTTAMASLAPQEAPRLLDTATLEAMSRSALLCHQGVMAEDSRRPMRMRMHLWRDLVSSEIRNRFDRYATNRHQA